MHGDTLLAASALASELQWAAAETRALLLEALSHAQVQTLYEAQASDKAPEPGRAEPVPPSWAGLTLQCLF